MMFEMWSCWCVFLVKIGPIGLPINIETENAQEMRGKCAGNCKEMRRKLRKKSARNTKEKCCRNAGEMRENMRGKCVGCFVRNFSIGNEVRK